MRFAILIPIFKELFKIRKHCYSLLLSVITCRNDLFFLPADKSFFTFFRFGSAKVGNLFLICKKYFKFFLLLF